jgi:hypothetical protein
MEAALHATLCFNFDSVEVGGVLFSSNLNKKNGEAKLSLCLILTHQG